MTKTKTLCINLQRTLSRSGVAFETVEKLIRHGIGVDDFRTQLETDFSAYYPKERRDAFYMERATSETCDEFYELRKTFAIDLFVDKLLQYAVYGRATYAIPFWVSNDSRAILKEYGRNIINHPHGVQS